MKVLVTIGADRFEVEGNDIPFGDVLPELRAWMQAITARPDVDGIAARLEGQSDKLAAAVAAHAPEPPVDRE